MAKWGEGDPRWIVEDRPDATNVNNWHWTEKNASSWSKEKLKDLLVDFCVRDDAVGELKIIEIEQCEGDASANNRKAKLIFFYEWDLKLKWEGRLYEGKKKKVEGQMHIPNLSEENKVSELDVAVTVTDTDDECLSMKDFARNVAADQIRQQLGKYIEALKNEFSHDMILAKPDEDQIKRPEVDSTVRSAVQKQGGQQESKKKSAGGNIETATLTMKETFKCRAQEIYNALTIVEMVTAFTRGEAKVDPNPGGRFELFGGNVCGTFVELETGKRIVQRWRFQSWPDQHFSKVTFEFTQKDDCTEVQLTQTGVPKSDLEHTKEGWNKYYWESMKRTFGFGAFIL